MNENIAINTSNINKNFGNFRALKDLSITIPHGEIFGFIGKNGAGKTTLMRIICGLMKPSSGILEVKKHIGFLPQNVRFRDNMVASETLHFFAKLRDCSVQESITFAKELELDLSKKINNLSPGQQRKLQLAIATIGMPEILVLDEPTAGLDPTGVQQVRGIIRLLNPALIMNALNGYSTMLQVLWALFLLVIYIIANTIWGMHIFVRQDELNYGE